MGKRGLSILMFFLLCMSLFVPGALAASEEPAEVSALPTADATDTAPSDEPNASDEPDAAPSAETEPQPDAALDTAPLDGESSAWSAYADTSWYHADSSAFTLSTAAELAGLAQLVNEGQDSFAGKTITLSASIDLSGHDWTPIGSSAVYYIGDAKKYARFEGRFDGGGFTLSGVQCGGIDAEYVGLFGRLNGGRIENLVIASSTFTGRQMVGSIVGENSGTVKNCSTAASVTVSNSASAFGSSEGIGGLVGGNYGAMENCTNKATLSATADCVVIGGVAGGNYGSMTGCTNAGAVTGGAYMGGITGWNNAPIRSCTNSAAVTYIGSSYAAHVGGIAGYCTVLGPISDCANTASIDGATGFYIGGILGLSEANNVTGIVRCYNTGSVGGKMYIGGIVGKGQTAVIDCYNTGAVSGNRNVGGVAGMCYTQKGSLKNCYNTGTITATGSVPIDIGAVVGSGSNCGGISNCFYLTGCGGYYDSNKLCAQKTAEEFADGSVLALLKNGAATSPWTQADTDSSPLLAAAATSPSHTHDWTYSASGSSLTAVCDEKNCFPVDVTTTLSILAPSDLTYNGTAKAAALNRSSIGGIATLPAIEYRQQTGPETWSAPTTTAPTNAGTYRASITIDTDKTAFVDYTIAPKTISIALFTVAPKLYNGSREAEITLLRFDGLAAGDTLEADRDYTASAVFDSADLGTNKTVTLTVSLKTGNYILANSTATGTGSVYIPTATPAPTPAPASTTARAPQTGDEANALVWLALLGFGCLAAAVITRKRYE